MQVNARPVSFSWRGAPVTNESFRAMPARDRASLIMDQSTPIKHAVSLMGSLAGKLSQPTARDFVDTFKCIGRPDPVVRLFYHSEATLVQRLPELIEGMQAPHWAAELFAHPDMPMSAITFAMEAATTHPNFPGVRPTVSYGTLSAILDSPRLPITRAADMLARYYEVSCGEYFHTKMTGIFRILSGMKRPERIFGLYHDEFSQKCFAEALAECNEFYPEEVARLREINASR